MELREVNEKDLVVGQTYYDVPNKEITEALVFVGVFSDSLSRNSTYFFPLGKSSYIPDEDGTISFPSECDEVWYEEI